MLYPMVDGVCFEAERRKGVQHEDYRYGWGLGPQATIDFEARVHEVSQRLVPQSASSG